MKMNWIVLLVGVSILIVVCDAKNKKLNKNEASAGSKSNDELAKSKEVNTRNEKPLKVKHKNDEKAKNKKTGKKLTGDKSEKTSTGPQETVAPQKEEVVSKSVVAEEMEPATLEAGEAASSSVQSKSVEEKKTSKSKAAKKTNKQSKKERATEEKEQVPAAVEEPAPETISEKAEL